MRLVIFFQERDFKMPRVKAQRSWIERKWIMLPFACVHVAYFNWIYFYGMQKSVAYDKKRNKIIKVKKLLIWTSVCAGAKFYLTQAIIEKLTYKLQNNK